MLYIVKRVVAGTLSGDYLERLGWAKHPNLAVVTPASRKHACPESKTLVVEQLTENFYSRALAILVTIFYLLDF